MSDSGSTASSNHPPSPVWEFAPFNGILAYPSNLDNLGGTASKRPSEGDLISPAHLHKKRRLLGFESIKKTLLSENVAEDRISCLHQIKHSRSLIIDKAAASKFKGLRRIASSLSLTPSTALGSPSVTSGLVEAINFSDAGLGCLTDDQDDAKAEFGQPQIAALAPSQFTNAHAPLFATPTLPGSTEHVSPLTLGPLMPDISEPATSEADLAKLFTPSSNDANPSGPATTYTTKPVSPPDYALASGAPTQSEMIKPVTPPNDATNPTTSSDSPLASLEPFTTQNKVIEPIFNLNWIGVGFINPQALFVCPDGNAMFELPREAPLGGDVASFKITIEIPSADGSTTSWSAVVKHNDVGGL